MNMINNIANAPTAWNKFQPICETIWDQKYRMKKADGTPIDVTVEDTWSRIAKALAVKEDDPVAREKEFYDALENFAFLPAGRITSGAGTGRRVTLFNCFVMGTIPDSMSGIFDMLKEAALTMQQGGGIGYDFSTLRPKGEHVKGVDSDASGPLSFMDVWDAMCRTIMSAGSRRGAMMATMRCDHPDVMDFIKAKQDSARLRMFNLSVLITDAFMEAVFADADWDLVWDGEVKKTVRALDLWNTIMDATYNFAEPGVIFIDRINERNPLKYCEQIAATNPCGEQPLPPYGACLLGSINLTRMIQKPFENGADLDRDLLKKRVATAVRMMDNVIDVSGFALDEQKQEAQNKRRIGLGVTGLADALIMVGEIYGSEQAIAKTEEWMRDIAHAAYRTSVELAKEKGAFPLFDAEKYLASPTIQQLDEDLKADIAEHGIRNALLTSIAPTGTISLYAGNVSSGVEPVFALSYNRKVLQKDGSHVTEEVMDYAVQVYREKFGDVSNEELPEEFVTAMTLTPMDHVRMQAAAQKWVDSAISKTINCPENIDFEDFKDVYIQAYKMGCKGCTTYRPNDVTGSVLSVSEDKKADKKEDNTATMLEPLTERPEVLEGRTYKIKWPNAAHAYYVTINHDPEHKRPFEVFVKTTNTHDADMLTALTRMISAVFRRGGDVAFVAEELRQITNPEGGFFINGKYQPSLVAMIGEKIREHMITIGYLPADTTEQPDTAAEVQKDTGTKTQTAALGQTCPSCGEKTLIKKEGCMSCVSCTYSKCS